MTQEPADKAEQIEALLDSPDLANALESEQFKKFLDQVPIAISVAELRTRELIVYANPEFERLSDWSAAKVFGQPWSVLKGEGVGKQKDRSIADAIVQDSDCAGIQSGTCGVRAGNRRRLFQPDRERRRTAVLQASRAG